MMLLNFPPCELPPLLVCGLGVELGEEQTGSLKKLDFSVSGLLDLAVSGCPPFPKGERNPLDLLSGILGKSKD